jgi:hypothetical protein
VLARAKAAEIPGVRHSAMRRWRSTSGLWAAMGDSGRRRGHRCGGRGSTSNGFSMRAGCR